MQRSQLIRLLAREAGRIPTLPEQALLEDGRDFQLALKGDAQACARCVVRYREAVRKDNEARWEGSRILDRDARRPPVTSASITRGATAVERKRAAVHAKRIVHLAAEDPEVQGFRARLAQFKAATIRGGETRADQHGTWEEVEVHLRSAIDWGPAKLRLHAEPLALEASGEDPYSRAKSDSPYVWLLWQARRTALRYGWSEAQAVRFLLAGEIPNPGPLVVRVLRTCADDGTQIAKSITVMAHEDVSLTSVARAFSQAKERRKGRPVEPRTLALVEFVKKQTAENGGIKPPSSHLRRKWNATHRMQPFKSDDDLRRTLNRALAKDR